MRVKEIKCYEFKELSKEAKQKAIQECSEINTDYEWWDCIYEDAEMAGIKITEFDVSYRQNIKGKLTDSMEDSIKYILGEHGKDCETYKTAEKFKEKMQVLAVKIKLLGEEDGFDEGEDEEIKEEYLNEILSNFWKILKNAYEYNTSEEAIIEGIEANEFEFDEEGNRI